MKKYKVRCLSSVSPEELSKYGTVKISGYFWKDEFVLETNLGLDDIWGIPGIIGVEKIS